MFLVKSIVRNGNLLQKSIRKKKVMKIIKQIVRQEIGEIPW